MEYLRLHWDDIVRQCRALSRRIRDEEVDFDIMVGIARGGWPPARLISDMLHFDDVHNMRVKFYTTLGETAKEPLILHPTQFDMTGKKVLLVDDIADTGGSLIAAVDHLKERGAARVTVVTLVKKPTSKIEPDLFIDETGKWVVFPWEVNETIRELSKTRKGDELASELEKAGISGEEYEFFKAMKE